ncbi:DUF2807 domain-containing protein [Microbulbifer salipaludis]|uniref:DUF2807 domain-containing protein n=1 Tax=Microbulbifer salipaludis TaxID=187980 RepID=A0ABS3E9E6_9GAMM|nr:DUF2807 domain-containing protein [Microbulbifer salipaludis]MBN8431932.1 DUF2807 domain-containing protein [Microbulbifer salipaludis]
MFRKLNIFVSLMVALSLMASAVHAQQSSRTFPLNGFTAIALKGGSNLQVVQGDTFSVTAEGEEADLIHAKAEVKGDTLVLSVEQESKSLFGIVTVSSEPVVEYRVTLPVIDSLRVTGSGDATADTLESEKLDLRVTGSGLIRVNKVAAETLSTGVTGSGDLLLGTVLAVHGSAGVTGSGDIRVENFVGEDFSAQIKGSGDIAVGGKVANVNVTVMGSGDFMGRNLVAKTAGGSIMGSGDIVLKRPVSESFSVMGSGDVALVE